MILDFIKKLLQSRRKSEKIDFNFFRDTALFKGLSDNELFHLSDLFIYKHFRKDEIIFKENYPHVVLYIIYEGSLKLYNENDDDGQFTKILKVKDFIGEKGIFIDIYRQATAKALEETTLIAINKNDLKGFIRRNPATGVRLLYNLGKVIVESDYNLNIQKQNEV